MTGTIDGGWVWVIAAYSLTWTVWTLYALSLWLRARRSP